MYEGKSTKYIKCSWGTYRRRLEDDIEDVQHHEKSAKFAINPRSELVLMSDAYKK